MDWEFFKLLSETAFTIVGYALFVGAGITGIVFAVSFLLWTWDRMRKEFYDNRY